MHSSPKSLLSETPLGFRMLAALLATAMLIAWVITIEVGDRTRGEQRAAWVAHQQRAAEALAGRASDHLRAGDDLRLAVLAAAALDLAGDGARVMMLDAGGSVRVDTGLDLGGRMQVLEPLEPGHPAAVVELGDGLTELRAASWSGTRRLGEVRLRVPQPPAATAFAWSMFGLVFLSSLSLICLAVALCHHWMVRVREASDAARRLAVGQPVQVMPVAPGVLGELQAAITELGFAVDRARAGGRDSVVELGLALVDQIEHRDQTPPGHGDRTARYAALLTSRLDLLPADRDDVDLAARLHDVGKVAVRPGILTKREPLEEEERASLRQHADRGASFFGNVPTLERVAQIVRHHHERFDGSGYPDGLRGERIPLGARIVAIADAYDVLTSCGAGNAGLDWQQALDQLRVDSGTHFDPWLLELFDQAVREDPIPSRPVRMVMISTSGVVPFSYDRGEAEQPGEEEDLVLDELETELELLREETLSESESER